MRGWSCAARRPRSIGSCARSSTEGLALRALELSETPLETLFFMLTESHSATTALVGDRGGGLTMSSTEVAPSLAATAVQARRPGSVSALGFELSKLFKQKRAPLTLAFAAVAPILIVIILKGQQRPPKDSLFGRYIHQTGWSVPLLILGFAGQWVLPLLTALVAGDIFAGEDQMGTWKTVLTRSVSRTQIFWAKTITATAFALSVLVVLTISTIITSVILVGHQPLVGLTGQLIPSHTAALLVSASWATAIPPLLAFTCFAILLVGAEPQPGLRDRGTCRDRDGDATHRLPRWRRGPASLPADDAVRGLARSPRRDALLRAARLGHVQLCGLVCRLSHLGVHRAPPPRRDRRLT